MWLPKARSTEEKAQVIEEAPDIFDYSELSKYGFSYLATPIMNAGGRREMYGLMGLPEPATSNRIKKPKKVPKLVIDKTGETDRARYSGLKVTQILDDDEMGKRLAEVQEKTKKGESIKAKLVEEDFVMPFAGTFPTKLNFMVLRQASCLKV